LLGNGDGTFQQYNSGYSGSSPVRIVAADLNGDGYLDIAIADANSASACTCTPDGHGVTTYMGDGSGSVSSGAAVQRFAPGVRASAIAIGDFNEDGHPDLVITDIGNNVVSVLLNNAAATAPIVTLALGNTPTAGASLTLMATVSSSPGPATGTVSFLDNSTMLGTATLAEGSASFTIPSVAAGAHSFSAAYAGSGTVGAGASAPVTVNVAQDFALTMPASHGYRHGIRDRKFFVSFQRTV
jgi:hypothetical protein